MLTPSERSAWGRLKRKFQSELPLRFPIAVRVLAGYTNCWSYLYTSPKRHYLIRLAGHRSFSERCQDFVHEYAHCHHWDTGDDKLELAIKRWVKRHGVPVNLADLSDFHSPMHDVSEGVCRRLWEQFQAEEGL